MRRRSMRMVVPPLAPAPCRLIASHASVRPSYRPLAPPARQTKSAACALTTKAVDIVRQFCDYGRIVAASLLQHRLAKSPPQRPVLRGQGPQLDHARSLSFSKKEMIWLAGNTFYGRKQIFEPEFLAWLEDFLLRWPATLIFVTHDRAFLRTLATRLLRAASQSAAESGPGV